MTYENIAEVVVGVTARGDATPGTIRFGGKPIARGVYSASNVPPGFKWNEFARKAIQHDGFGLTVLYVGDERINAAVRSAAEKMVAADKRQLDEQAKVRDAMVGGRHVAEHDTFQGEDKGKVKGKTSEVTPNE